MYAETCPHFLTFNETVIDTHGPYLKFTPVMRNEENRRQLWDAIAKGMIDTIGSDHCPSTVEEKERDKDDIWKAPNGLPGLETLLPVFLTGVNEGLVSLEKGVEITSANPAKFLALHL